MAHKGKEKKNEVFELKTLTLYHGLFCSITFHEVFFVSLQLQPGVVLPQQA